MGAGVRNPRMGRTVPPQSGRPARSDDRQSRIAHPPLVTSVLVAVWFTAWRPVAAWALLGWGVLNLVGAILTVLPLGILPFDPQQTLFHYSFHAIYAIAQVPLILTTAIWLVVGRRLTALAGDRARHHRARRRIGFERRALLPLQHAGRRASPPTGSVSVRSRRRPSHTPQEDAAGAAGMTCPTRRRSTGPNELHTARRNITQTDPEADVPRPSFSPTTVYRSSV